MECWSSHSADEQQRKMASPEATSVLAWFEFYTRLYEDDVSVARPSRTLLQLLQSAFPSLYEEFVARRLMLGTDEWTCVVVLLEAFYEIELSVDRSALDDAMTLESACEHTSFGRILEFAVCALVQSDSKARFVGDIMTMDDSVQVDIMAVIERMLRHTSNLASSTGNVQDNGDLGPTCTQTSLDEDDQLHSSSSQSSSERLQASPASPTSSGSQSPMHLARHTELERLQRANDILKEDNIHISRELEEVRSKLSHAEIQNASLQEAIENVRLQAEMSSLKKERTIRSYFDERVHSLQRELDRTTSELEEKTAIVKEVEELRDEIDLLRPAAEKLAKAETTLGKYKMKIEELTSVKEKLRRIEEANADLVEKNLVLESQAAKSATLQRKLAESKEANTTIQFHVSELETKVSRLNSELEARRAESEASKAALLEATTLNKQLQETIDQQVDTRSGISSSSTGIVEGICELNPELMEKMARLEHDNATLRSQVDGTTTERIDALLDEIDDLTRMKKSFETKYFDTFENLSQTKVTLTSTEEHVVAIEGMLNACKQDLVSMTDERDALKQSLELSEQEVRNLNSLVHDREDEIIQRREHEAQLTAQVDEHSKTITSLNQSLQEALRLLRLSNERREALQEDVTANEQERSSLVASRKKLAENFRILSSHCEAQVCRIKDLETEVEQFIRGLETAQATIALLKESEARYAMRCEDVEAELKTKTDQINDQDEEIRELRTRTKSLEIEVNELQIGERHAADSIRLLTERLHCTREDLAMIQSRRQTLMEEVGALVEQEKTRQCQIQESHELNLALVEDFRQQLVIAEEQKLSELQQLECAQAQERERLTKYQDRLIASHEDQLQVLTTQHAETVANMTRLIDEKCNLLQRAMDDIADLRVKHEDDVGKMHRQFDLANAKLVGERESVAMALAEYELKHNFSDEEVLNRQAIFQKELSDLTAKFEEERSKLHEQRDSLSAQVDRLHGANRDMKLRFEGQESKLREAVRIQLETNRKLVEANHAVKSELTKKEAQVIQLENAVTRLDSKIVVLERERNHYSSEEGKHRDNDDSSTSYSSQLSIHVTQIVEELDSLRKENKRLQEQLSLQVNGDVGHDDTTPQSSKSYLLERIRHLEHAKALEEDKKRELLLMNAKLIQDQKQIQVRTALDLKEVNSLKEKLNMWMLRDERRKKEHETIVQRVQTLELENRQLRSKLEGEVSDASGSRASQSSQESIDRVQSIRPATFNDQENIPPTDGPAIASKKRKFEDNSIPEDLPKEVGAPSDKQNNCTRDTDRFGTSIPAPQPASSQSRTKRRMSHFISNRPLPVAQSDEKPSECQQQ